MLGYGIPVSTGSGVWGIISLVLAIVGGIVTYLLFLPAKNGGKYTGFLKWLYEFLSFKFLTIEVILKVVYMIMAIWITLASFASGSVVAFFVTLIIGNLVLRITFEGCLLLIMLYKNTKEINSKIK